MLLCIHNNKATTTSEKKTFVLASKKTHSATQKFVFYNEEQHQLEICNVKIKWKKIILEKNSLKSQNEEDEHEQQQRKSLCKLISCNQSFQILYGGGGGGSCGSGEKQ